MSGWLLFLAGVGVFVESLILYRAFVTGSVRKYAFFCVYIACVLLVDVSRDVVYLLDGRGYLQFYFVTEFLSLLVGYGVVLEVTRKSLEAYPGAERLSRHLIISIFLAIFGYVSCKALVSAGWSPANSLMELERDLRGVQALVILSVVALLFYYRIEIGRNLRGIILGYGMYIASLVIGLALRSYGGGRLDLATRTAQPYTYLLCLLIWLVALWSYAPNPVRDASMRLEVDYETLVGRTRGMLGTMRQLLERSARS